MTLRERNILEGSVRCEILLAAMPGLQVAIGEIDAEERTEVSRLYKEASSALWKLHKRFGGGA